MSTSHTPGPWHIGWNISRLDIFVAGGQLIARLLRSTKDGAPTYDDAEAVANARLIAAAPDLLEALQWREQFEPRAGEDSIERFERIAETFSRETGYLRPGKDCRMYSIEERQAVWDEWMEAGRTRVRAAIANATGTQP